MREVTSAEASAFVAVAAKYGDAAQVKPVLQNSRHFIISDSTGDIIGYSIEPAGSVAFITAAAEIKRTRYDMTSLLDLLICEQVKGFEQVAFRTNRVGLMRKAARLGYKRNGNILSKYL